MVPAAELESVKSEHGEGKVLLSLFVLFLSLSLSHCLLL